MAELARSGEPVPVAEVFRHRRLTGACVLVRYADGLPLVEAGLRAVWDGGAERAYIESPRGQVTSLAGDHWGTVRAAARGRVPDDHPAARVVPYAGGCPKALADVLWWVFDPSWYVDPAHRGRLARLEARLGLTPRWARCGSAVRRALTAAWLPERPIGPADFFARMYGRRLAAGAPPERAARAVGRYFVKCLAAAWLDGRRPRGAERLFVPELMFDAPALAAVRKGA
jgi:hypothetical protein